MYIAATQAPVKTPAWVSYAYDAGLEEASIEEPEWLNTL